MKLSKEFCSLYFSAIEAVKQKRGDYGFFLPQAWELGKLFLDEWELQDLDEWELQVLDEWEIQV